METLTKTAAYFIVGALCIAFIWWIGAPRVWTGFMNLVGSLFTIALAVLVILWALTTLVRAAAKAVDWLRTQSDKQRP